ncbi:MAG TPA: AI-2E family transporter [Oscillatoriales cyanobacterium M59_W2019_021]|nr:AI-2E family transporter [Oscillatoriales cyanobacterium M4454_W2019_049]HIK49948.1 AI-2E family transporter [Oscillatoriales cyanobacterium M59_W2019_021]
MKPRTQIPSWIVWALAFPLAALNAWLLIVAFRYFRDPIAIFISATLIAFILNYPVQFLVSHRVPRTRAVFWVVGIAFLLLGVAGVTLAPIVISQFNDLANRLPTWLESGSQQLRTLNDWAIERNLPIDLTGIAAQLSDRLSGQLQSLTGQLLDLIFSTVGSVLNIVLTLILTFYILLHGEELWEGICAWLPEPIGSRVRPLLSRNFHNYYVGQASLAAMMGGALTLAFVLLKVPFGLLFGLGVGFMAFFPFGGALGICLVGLLMALQSFWLGVRVLIVSVIIEQAIENGIAPKLLGGFTGLNPVWVLVSLLIGARVGGILGLLIAVPMAGFIKSTATVLRSDRWDRVDSSTSPPLTQEVKS